MEITTAKELGEALKANAEQIIITGELLTDSVDKLKALEAKKWVAIGAALGSIALMPVIVVSTPILGVLVGILGVKVADVCKNIITAGGVKAFLSLQNYEITEKEYNRIVLKRS